MFINIRRVGVRRMGPDSFQWCPVTGQGGQRGWSRALFSGAQCQDLGQWAPPETQEVPSERQETFFYSEGDTGCPGRLWSLRPWRYSEALWAWSWAAGSGWPCLGGEVGPDELQRFLPWVIQRGELFITSGGVLYLILKNGTLNTP